MAEQESRRIAVAIEIDDVLAFRADVLAVKHAQALYGVDAAVFHRIFGASGNVNHLLPAPRQSKLMESEGRINCKAVLFVGVEPLRRFGYKEIREFAHRALAILGELLPETRHVALTVHGPGFGLDEAEAFESEIAGLFDAFAARALPSALERITIVEVDRGRATRLRETLSRLLPDGTLQPTREAARVGSNVPERLRTAGATSTVKPHIFVAMPFDEDMDDVFHYGIQNAAHAAGYLCERADISSFTGDIVEWIKERIAAAALVIADLSTANANVYLEVGFAWGRDRPTLLLVRDLAELKFDVKGHRCIVYKKIKDLEDALRKELAQLKGH
jgi:hypothetical protein